MTDNQSWHEYATCSDFNRMIPYSRVFIGGRGGSTGNLRWSNTWADILIIAKEILDADK